MEKPYISLTEYSVKYGLSISTLRRYIKEGRLGHRMDEGKYLIPDSPMERKKRGRKPGRRRRFSLGSQEPSPGSQKRIESLEKMLNQSREENAELKMYVQVLEEKLGMER